MGGRLFIAGTRTFSAEVIDFARDGGWEVEALLEPFDEERPGTRIHGLPVHWLEDHEAPESAFAIVGTGEPRRRPVVARLRERGWPLATLVHPTAHLAPTSEVGEGCIVGPLVVIGAKSLLGANVVAGRGALIGHHTTIEDFATLGPGANVAGNTRLGPDSFLGMGATVRDHIEVGAGATVAMGAVVVDDVADGLEVRGVPAKAWEPSATRL